ncbi:MAG: long-chain-fatty-acid--CoA ligase [Candidatus Hodarchaeales archaeon]
MEEMLWHKYKWPQNVKKSLKPYPKEPLHQLLDEAAKKHPDHIYTLFEGVATTFKECKESAERIADYLKKAGIKKGDKVAIFLPNVPHFPIIFFGILKVGATVVTCNPMYTARELKYQLKDSEAKVVFCLDHDKFTPVTYKAIEGTQIKRVVVCSVKTYLPKIKAFLGGVLGKIPKSPYYETDVTDFYEEIMKKFLPVVPEVEIDPLEDVAVIIYTGGTTGVPKGVLLTHRNLYCNLVQFDEWVKIELDDGSIREIREGEEVFIGALPWYHCYGLELTMIAAAYKACKVIPIPDPRAGKYPLSVVLESIHKHRGTILHAVPTIYAGIANHPEVSKYDLTSVVACGSGAAPLPPEVAKNFETVTGATLFEGYGMTEASPLTHANPTNKRDRKFGSVGLPMPDTYVKILDLETGTKEMPIGEDGEIAVSGPQVMKGYWNKPEETSNVLKEIEGKTFFLTGDIGHLDEEGYTWVTDRKKDMINVSGLKAYPREIEDVLYEHPDIKYAAAIGIPRENDPSNEYVKAFVVLKEGSKTTPEEIKEFCHERLAAYKRPKTVEIRDELPLSTVGKVLRRVLRDEEVS